MKASTVQASVARDDDSSNGAKYKKKGLLLETLFDMFLKEGLGDGDAFIEIHILNCIEHFNAICKRALKRFTSQY